MSLNLWLYSFNRIPQKIRVLGSLVSILVVFCVTAILVKLSINPMPFFVITLIKIAIINGESLSLTHTHSLSLFYLIDTWDNTNTLKNIQTLAKVEV